MKASPEQALKDWLDRYTSGLFDEQEVLEIEEPQCPAIDGPHREINGVCIHCRGEPGDE